MDIIKLWFENAIELQINGKVNEAKVIYKKILDLNPNNFDALHLLGISYFEQKKYTKSKKLIKRALEINSDIAEAHFNLGNSLLALHELEEAKRCYQKAIDLKPDYVDAYNNLGTVFRSRQQYKDAQLTFESALKIAPSSKLWHNYGNVLSDQKLYEKAEEAFKNAIKLDSQAFFAWDSLGSIYANQGRHQEALPFYQHAIKIQPEFSDAHSNIGGTYIELGKSEQALSHVKKAIQINPNSLPALVNLSLALIHCGFFDEALIILRQVKKIDSKYIKYITAIGRLKCLCGDWKSAINFYTQSFNHDPLGQGLEDGVYVAILKHLIGNRQHSKEYLALTNFAKESQLKIHKTARAYWYFLNALHNNYLIDYDCQSFDLMFVIGESHSIPYSGIKIIIKNNILKCKSHWIPGCKQWHLGNKKPNQYKASVRHHFNSLPKGSNILMVIGEIDCRPDEGIIKFHYQNTEIPLDFIVESTITNYLDWLVDSNRNMHHQIIISGIPATNINLNKLELISSDSFTNFLKIFNQMLCNESLNRGFKFLDIFSMTNKGDGTSNGKWHIDEFHLSPSAGREAFDKYLIA